MTLSSVMYVCFTYVYVTVVVSMCMLDVWDTERKWGGKMRVGGESRIGVLV